MEFKIIFLKGVSPIDVKNVSKLIGIKMFVNEFAAFGELGKAIQFRTNITESGLLENYKNGSLPIPNGIFMVWEDRSILISTYALCGKFDLLQNLIQTFLKINNKKDLLILHQWA